MSTKAETLHKLETAPHQLWCCPLCHGDFAIAEDSADGLPQWRCTECSAQYQLFDGIPDLRVRGESWIDYDDDRMLARRFMEETSNLPLADALQWIFKSRNKTFTDK